MSLSSSTKECQLFCDNYHQEAENFLAGMEFGLVEKNPDDSCSGAVNPTSRKNVKPNVFDGVLDKERSFYESKSLSKYLLQVNARQI
ncbi:MAG: hypothetical protein PHY93_08070 [Bacteriovorax sp.]|nr:hypothetical protein [Bacteriovorax sp.]